MKQTQANSFTIGVIGNRQLYVGTTIARYEQSLLRGVRAAAQRYGCHVVLVCGIGPDTALFQALPAWPISVLHTNLVPVGPWNTAGLIVIPPFTDDQMEVLQSALPAAHPLVFTHPQPSYPSVGPANRDGIAQAFATWLHTDTDASLSWLRTNMQVVMPPNASMRTGTRSKRTDFHSILHLWLMVNTTSSKPTQPCLEQSLCERLREVALISK